MTTPFQGSWTGGIIDEITLPPGGILAKGYCISTKGLSCCRQQVFLDVVHSTPGGAGGSTLSINALPATVGDGTFSNSNWFVAHERAGLFDTGWSGTSCISRARQVNSITVRASDLLACQGQPYHIEISLILISYSSSTCYTTCGTLLVRDSPVEVL